MKSVVTIGLSGDAGCHVALVNLHKKLLKMLKSVKILHSYILIDEKEIPSEIDLALLQRSAEVLLFIGDLMRLSRERAYFG